MRKIILGLISILFIGQILQAQPVSDMAVIPMGITIQSVMRLTITKGGNIEFVFENAKDIQDGIPSGGYGPEFETKGKITASRNWDLNLTIDEANFMGEISGTTLNLNVVEFNSKITPLPPNTIGFANVPLASGAPIKVLEKDGGASAGDNIGSGLDFTIQWQCGHANKISGNVKAQRYSANIILTLTAK